MFDIRSAYRKSLENYAEKILLHKNVSWSKDLAAECESERWAQKAWAAVVTYLRPDSHRKPLNINWNPIVGVWTMFAFGDSFDNTKIERPWKEALRAARKLKSRIDKESEHPLVERDTAFVEVEAVSGIYDAAVLLSAAVGIVDAGYPPKLDVENGEIIICNKEI